VSHDIPARLNSLPRGCSSGTTAPERGGHATARVLHTSRWSGRLAGALKQIAPGLKRVSTIYNPNTAPYHPLYLRAIEQSAPSFAVEPIATEVHNDADIERAISTLAREPGGGLIVMPDTFNMVHRQTTIGLAARHRLPAIYYFPFFAREGGLISYGPDEIDMFRRAAGYVDRILRGAKARDLPVQQPTAFRLVINLKTAKALGLTIPPSVLARADEVIE
jgi:ABC-type uncharacterized transport system substrate-binding protein